jgi:protein SCO1/2
MVKETCPVKRIITLIVPALVLVPSLVLLAVGPRSSATMPSGLPAASREADSLATRLPNVQLRTQANETVRFYDDLVKGKTVLINFMFTGCTTLCPRTTENLAKIQQALGDHVGRDIFIVSISVDPQTDTPAVLEEYAERFHTKPGWTFVTGKEADIALLRRQLGVADDDEGKARHTGMLIYGSDVNGNWGATPIMRSASSVARTILRLVGRTSSSAAGGDSGS